MSVRNSRTSEAAAATATPEKGEAPSPARDEASESGGTAKNHSTTAPGVTRTHSLWLRSHQAGDAPVAPQSDSASLTPEEFDGLAVDAGKADELARLTGARWASVQVCEASGPHGDENAECGECLRCALLSLAGASRNLLGSNCRFGEQCELAATLEHAEGVLHG
jgi:hypothetical protein